MTERVKIGITGGIGSGKSYVCRLLEQHGMPIYDSDTEAKRLMREHTGIREQLIALLGKEVYGEDGSLNKPLVSSFLFSSPQHAALVNGIVHPMVKADFLSWTSRHSGVVGVESAILFESGLFDAVDFVVEVQAPLQVRVRRACLRDHVTEDSIVRRIKAQMDDAERADKADFVIKNDGILPLEPQIDAFINVLGSWKNNAGGSI